MHPKTYLSPTPPTPLHPPKKFFQVNLDPHLIQRAKNRKNYSTSQISHDIMLISILVTALTTILSTVILLFSNGIIWFHPILYLDYIWFDQWFLIELTSSSHIAHGKTSTGTIDKHPSNMQNYNNNFFCVHRLLGLNFWNSILDQAIVSIQKGTPSHFMMVHFGEAGKEFEDTYVISLMLECHSPIFTDRIA